MRIDHVLYGVRDLADAQRWFVAEFGFHSTRGGVHPDIGSENAIIPVGPGQYVELITVVDDTISHPLPKVLNAMIADGDRPVGLCLRPDNVEAVAERLGLGAVPMHRQTPDGRTIEWRLVGMEAALGPQRLPLFIDWGSFAAEVDAEHAAAAPDGAITRVEVGGDADALRDWIGAEIPEVIPVGGPPGVSAIHIRRGHEELVLGPR